MLYGQCFIIQMWETEWDRIEELRYGCGEKMGRQGEYWRGFGQTKQKQNAQPIDAVLKRKANRMEYVIREKGVLAIVLEGTMEEERRKGSK